MALVVAFDTAHAGWAEDTVARREDLVRLGLWLFLATVTMLFAAFTSAYIVRRSGHDWHHGHCLPSSGSIRVSSR